MLTLEQLSPAQRSMHDSLGSKQQKKIFLERQETYGPFEKCHANLGMAWTALLQNHFNITFEHPIPGFVAALMLGAMKQVRAMNSFHQDNYDDLLNYSQFANHMQKEEPKPVDRLTTIKAIDWSPVHSALKSVYDHPDTYKMQEAIPLLCTALRIVTPENTIDPELLRTIPERTLQLMHSFAVRYKLTSTGQQIFDHIQKYLD